MKELYNYHRFSVVKLNIENVRQLAKLVGDPGNKFHTVHVTGTNGKGSVCWKIYKALMESGYKTGLFTSPHVSCYRERIRINDEYIPEDYVKDNLELLFHLSKTHNISTSFFEYTTILSYKYFMEQKIDVGVIEVGLGGRLDATNIITPDISCITSIGLEHTKILGNALEEIAVEKGGIIKPNIPVVVGKDLPVKILKEIAMKQNSPFYQIDCNKEYKNYNEINIELAKKCLNVLKSSNPLYYSKINDDSINYGIKQQLSNRMEIIKTTKLLNNNNDNKEDKRNVILDCSHNPQAFKTLFNSLPDNIKQRNNHIILGFSNDKDIKSCLETTIKYIKYENIHFVKSNNYRSVSQLELYNILKSILPNNRNNMDNIKENNKSIKDTIIDVLNKMDKNDYCFICGSIYLLGEVRGILGIKEPQDPIFE